MGSIVTWIPAAISAIVAIISAFNFSEYVAAHPVLAAIVAGVSAVIAALMPSPLKK